MEKTVEQQLLNAIQFATEKHKGQFRKGFSKTPFINHPINVADILANNGEADNIILLKAAILHDVLEDTNTKANELIENFGVDVCKLVLECTDNKNLVSEDRKQAQIDCVCKASTNAKKLKLADKISNIKDIIIDPPIGWSIDRRLDYLEWANDVCCQINGVNEKLEQLFNNEMEMAKIALITEANLV